MSDTLKKGSKGDAVEALQGKLQQLGFDVKTDGIFGPNTAEAVEELQSAFGYDVDGIVGKGTHGLIDAQVGYGWNVKSAGAIKSALEAQGKQTDKGSLAGAELKRNLKQGADGADVKYLQRRLQALGFDVGVDGKFGEATDQAVKKLQSAFGYTIDGIVGPGTHKLINAQIGCGWNAKSGGAKEQPAAKA